MSMDDIDEYLRLIKEKSTKAEKMCELREMLEHHSIEQTSKLTGMSVDEIQALLQERIHVDISEVKLYTMFREAYRQGQLIARVKAFLHYMPIEQVADVMDKSVDEIQALLQQSSEQ